MEPITLNAYLPIQNKTVYRNKIKILGNNFKKINPNKKGSIYQFVNDDFAPNIKQIKKQQSISKSLRQTKNIFYIKMHQNQQSAINKSAYIQQKLPSLTNNTLMKSRNIVYEDTECVDNTSIDSSNQNKEQRKDCLLDLKSIRKHKVNTIQNKTKPNFGLNHTRYFFNDKKQLLINPQLGNLMFNKNYRRYQKSANICPKNIFEASLTGTQKKVYIKPNRTSKPKKIQNKINDKCLKLQQIRKQDQTSMTGLTLEAMSKKFRKQMQKQQIFTPWSISMDQQ